MKKLKFLTLIVITILSVSCEDSFLSPELKTGTSGDAFYSNDQELEAAVINIYDGLQGVNASKITSSNLNHATQVEFYLTEMRSDNTRTKSQEGEAAQFESFSIEATNGIVADYYRSFYDVIFRANVVLDNIDAASETAAGKIEGEAKFLRAYAYFNLVRLYGDVPLITKVIAPLDTETAFTRINSTEIYALIIEDLQTAIDNLDDSFKDRASKAAAQGLLAKVYLTLPTPNYAQAQLLCEEVLDPARGFELLSNYSDVFFSERNDEILFAIGYEQGDNNNSQNFSAEWLNSVGRTSGVNYATTDVVTALEEMGGERTQHTYRIDPFQPTENQAIKYLPNGESGGDNGRTFSSDAQAAGNDWIVLRYADVVLLHVESILGGGESTSNSNALTSFNSIRNRAGLPNDADGVITKEELLNERRVELAFENKRLFDLIRMGEAVNVLSEFATTNGYSFSSTDLLLPIPQREIGLSKGVLTQNPGY
ncbi:RagB/SusD family nutrient uptake outer membrane protein [Cellulophaga sp. 20_2_10]|uniref:RagB/SusD family nutrient uptake outer membrane protein n=1 Tax=Cellulophaga sp. 20_2_10 TaxID=2942476 RepID=UPI00201AD2F3|nr:RagB/SusD family nutrient uptake outer membrane protein [Cellulophaga sp. 20_2_10]MCL5247700.1 RagB/SusD family nutrient uptake outer membrane protein [Cellulophaga sp. 20_2_10]